MNIVESWGGQCSTFIIFSAFVRFIDLGLKELNIKFLF